MWQLTVADLEAIAIGAGILGTGGGGNPYLGMLRLRRLLEAGHAVTIIPPEALADDALVAVCAGIGAPTVGIEKIEQGMETVWALRGLEREVGRPATAVVSAEIGGGNSIEPMVVGALTGLPVVDADGMGRAFPEVQMTTFFIYGVSPAPAVLCDEKGNQVVIRHAKDAVTVERFARVVTIQMGGAAGMALAPMSGLQLRQTGVPYTLRLSCRLGRAVRQARREHADPIAAIAGITGAVTLARGKIVDVQRETVAGFARGAIWVEGLQADRGRTVRVQFQNENLIAWEGDEALACVPDLICVVEQETGEPITTEQLRYGQRVVLLGIPCSPLLQRPEALAVVGPAAFGYAVAYRPLGGIGPWEEIEE